MTNDLSFHTTASYYSRFRPPYPPVFFDRVIERYNLDIQNPKGELLDLGCGPGTLTIPLAPYFREVIGIDPEPEMLKQGALEQPSNLANITWLRGDSSMLCRLAVRLHLTVMGRSFHWMDRTQVLRDLHRLTQRGGGVVIVADPPMWDGKQDFQQAITALLKDILGPARRYGSSFYKSTGQSHSDFIRASAFPRYERFIMPVKRKWTIAELIGHCYSTSFASRAVLGDRCEEFEQRLRDALLALDPAGEFVEDTHFEVYLLYLE